jgi:hypothetical protein
VDGETVAALSSLVLRGAGPRQRLLDRILPALRRTSATISSQLAAES